MNVLRVYIDRSFKSRFTTIHKRGIISCHGILHISINIIRVQQFHPKDHIIRRTISKGNGVLEAAYMFLGIKTEKQESSV